MSRNRIKNISFGADDYYDEADDDYEENNELSPEDREQMRLRTAEVQELLRSELPPVEPSEEEVWEALWHYYYDVDKTVSYLRSECSRHALRSVPIVRYAGLSSLSTQKSIERLRSKNHRSSRRRVLKQMDRVSLLLFPLFSVKAHVCQKEYAWFLGTTEDTALHYWLIIW